MSNHVERTLTAEEQNINPRAIVAMEQSEIHLLNVQSRKLHRDPNVQWTQNVPHNWLASISTVKILAFVPTSVVAIKPAPF